MKQNYFYSNTILKFKTHAFEFLLILHLKNQLVVSTRIPHIPISYVFSIHLSINYFQLFLFFIYYYYISYTILYLLSHVYNTWSFVDSWTIIFQQDIYILFLLVFSTNDIYLVLPVYKDIKCYKFTV